MPVYDGWDFLNEYEKLPHELTEQTLLYMLSSSINPPDIQKAGNYRVVKSYITKPLTSEALSLIVEDYYTLRKQPGTDSVQG
jgi:CheY-like chemotaxis protein